MLWVAQKAAVQAGVHVHFLQHSLDMDLHGQPNSFDLVLAALVLCHIENLTLVAQQAYRLLRPGGHIMVTDFHPAVIAAGWRTQFTNNDGTYLLPTAQHTRDRYLTALGDTGFRIQTVHEALVRDAPAHAFPADVLVKDGDKPLCLVILAAKPTKTNPE